jgi:GT2 family glycosyltransferase
MLFSVVIAVKNEVKYIKRCLESVFNQDFDGKYEVIVVDGMSTDGTSGLLEKLQKKYDFKLFKNSKINAAAGRNIGINNSNGKYIAFVDGDAIPACNWLKQIKKGFEKFEKKDVAGVGGPDLLPEDSSDKEKNIGRVMTSPIVRGGKLNPSTQHSLMKEEKYVEHIPTCNLCLKREIFDKVGMFDESFVKGQDLELNYRITNAGYKLLYSPKIKVVHHRKDHIRDFAKQIYKWAKAKVAIIKKHGFRGLTSHVYLWPAYFLIGFFLSFIFFFLLNIMKIFALLFLIAMIFYAFVIIFESGQLSRKYKDNKLFLYSVFLIPIVHLSYFYGVLSALLRVRKKIW